MHKYFILHWWYATISHIQYIGSSSYTLTDSCALICFHVPPPGCVSGSLIWKLSNTLRLLTIGLKIWEFRCWGWGAPEEDCEWLAALVGGVAGFCWRSSLGGGGSGRDGGWGSGTTKYKVMDNMLHANKKLLYLKETLRFDVFPSSHEQMNSINTFIL